MRIPLESGKGCDWKGSSPKNHSHNCSLMRGLRNMLTPPKTNSFMVLRVCRPKRTWGLLCGIWGGYFSSILPPSNDRGPEAWRTKAQGFAARKQPRCWEERKEPRPKTPKSKNRPPPPPGKKKKKKKKVAPPKVSPEIWKACSGDCFRDGGILEQIRVFHTRRTSFGLADGLRAAASASPPFFVSPAGAQAVHRVWQLRTSKTRLVLSVRVAPSEPDCVTHRRAWWPMCPSLAEVPIQFSVTPKA